ncbi:MAG: FlgD immunoglobulin-like domain containing protein [Candidatus Krumholzibacteriia bacterium]
MRLVIALTVVVLIAPAVLAQPHPCADYTGVPLPFASTPPSGSYRSLVAVGDDLCAIRSLYQLQGWHVDADGVPRLGGVLAPDHGVAFSQLAVHGDRIFAAVGELGVMVHAMVDGTPAAVDSILVTRSPRLVAVAGDRLITSRGADRLLILDLAGPVPALVDSLALPGLAPGGAHGAGTLALVQTTSPAQAHVIDPMSVQILGTVDLPWTSRTVSWDGRLGLLVDADGDAAVLVDATDPTAPMLRPLPTIAGGWFAGGAVVDGRLWLTGCDIAAGGVLARFDVTDPANPIDLGRQAWNDPIVEAVTARGCLHAFTDPVIMCTTGSASLESVRLGSPGPLPTPLGGLQDGDLDAADHDVLAGSLLCRTNGYRLSIVDFADPSAPVLRAEIALPEHVTCRGIFASGPLVVIAGSGAGLAAEGGRILVYDVSAPAQPVLRSTTVCYRFLATAFGNDVLFTCGIDDDLYAWRLTAGGAVTFLVEHTTLTSVGFDAMLTYDDLLFAVEAGDQLRAWNVGDVFEPVELTDLPATAAYRYGGLASWDGGISWFGILGIDRYGYEMLTIEDGVPTSVRLVWEHADGSPLWPYGPACIGGRGDVLYLGGLGVLAVDLLSDPPAVVGLIPSRPGRLHLIDGYPVVEGYQFFETWAPPCGDPVTAPDEPPPASALTVWPNPFNPRLEIAFTMPVAGPLTVAIHDLRGRRLRTLARGHHEAGAHRFVWDGRDRTGRVAAAGVYVVRIEAAGRLATRRVTMLK